MTHENRLVIIAVIYNSHRETLQFAESIRQCFGNSASVVLVDNSADKPGSSFTDKILAYDFITYLHPGKNAGYFHGARHGLMHYMQSHQSYPEWTIVSNVDIIFETPEFQEKLDSLGTVPDVGVVAPSIVSRKWKTDLNPFLVGRIPLKKLFFLQTIYSNILIHNGYVLLYWLKKIMNMISGMAKGSKKNEAGKPQNIYAPHGSSIIFNHKYFERGGTLNHISFLFGEEIFVAETAKRLGLKVVYLPGLKLVHDEHSSIGNFISRKINAFYRQSLKDIMEHYYKV
ncbi:MAG: hypothetical protein WCJ26_03045 [bacterium]